VQITREVKIKLGARKLRVYVNRTLGVRDFGSLGVMRGQIGQEPRTAYIKTGPNTTSKNSSLMQKSLKLRIKISRIADSLV